MLNVQHKKAVKKAMAPQIRLTAYNASMLLLSSTGTNGLAGPGADSIKLK